MHVYIIQYNKVKVKWKKKKIKKEGNLKSIIKFVKLKVETCLFIYKNYNKYIHLYVNNYI